MLIGDRLCQPSHVSHSGYPVLPVGAGEQEWFTPKEAAAYLRIHVNTLYDWVRRGLVRGHPLPTGRGQRFRRRDLDEVLTKRPEDPPET